MIKKLIAFLLLNRVANSIGIKHEDKSSDVDAYSLYDSIKLSNLDGQTSFINVDKKKEKGSRPHSLSFVGANDGRKYINRMMKSFKPSKATGISKAETKEQKPANEGIAEFLLESGVKIGLVQAKVMTALKDYRKDIRKNMKKELVKRGVYDPITNTYNEFDIEEQQKEINDGSSSESSIYTSSSDSDSDSDE